MVSGVQIIGHRRLSLRLLMRWLSRGIRRRGPARPGNGANGGEGPPDAGVREPRRPLPFAGAGAVALPLPGSELDLTG
jgi:hypothetical protein